MSFAMTSSLPDPRSQSVFYSGVVPKRFFAWVIDVIVIAAISLFLGLLTLTILLWFWPILYLTVSFLYRTTTIATGSATLGMRIMNIQLRGPTGESLSSGEAAVHTLTFLVCSAFAVPQLISIVLMVIGDRHQGLHDHLIGSAAINRPR